jgi:hypothetical protein
MMPKYYPSCDDLKVALEKLLRANGAEYVSSNIVIRAISDGGPPAYVVTVGSSCAELFAEQLSRITGRIFFARAPSFVLYDLDLVAIRKDAEHIVPAGDVKTDSHMS